MKHTEETILRRAASSLADSTGLKVSVEPIHARQPTGSDGVIVIADGGKHWRSYVEVKGRLTAGNLGAAAAAVSRINRDIGSSALVTSYVNSSQAEKLRELGVEFFDTAGNAFLKRKGLYVFVTGQKAQDLEREERPARAFNATGLRLVFALLSCPELEKRPYRDIARAAGISLGALHLVMNDLKKLSFMIESRSRGRRLLNKKDLLKRWVEGYPERLRPKLLIGRYHSERKPDFWRSIRLPKDQAFWGGEMAGQILSSHLKPQSAAIYAESNLTELQAKYGLRRDERGEVELLRRFWRFEDGSSSEMQVVPPILVYADLLMTADERNLETAEIVYEQYISRLVE